MSAYFDVAPPGFDRRGKVLAVASGFVVGLLIASTIVVIWLGAKHWAETPNPNPGGMFSILFLYTTSIVLFGSIFSAFVMPTFAAWYGSTETWAGRTRTATRWMAAMLLFLALPFYVFGELIGPVSDLFGLAALIAFVSGSRYMRRPLGRKRKRRTGASSIARPVSPFPSARRTRSPRVRLAPRGTRSRRSAR